MGRGGVESQRSGGRGHIPQSEYVSLQQLCSMRDKNPDFLKERGLHGSAQHNATCRPANPPPPTHTHTVTHTHTHLQPCSNTQQTYPEPPVWQLDYPLRHNP